MSGRSAPAINVPCGKVPAVLRQPASSARALRTAACTSAPESPAHAVSANDSERHGAPHPSAVARVNPNTIPGSPDEREGARSTRSRTLHRGESATAPTRPTIGAGDGMIPALTPPSIPSASDGPAGRAATGRGALGRGALGRGGLGRGGRRRGGRRGIGARGLVDEGVGVDGEGDGERARVGDGVAALGVVGEGALAEEGSFAVAHAEGGAPARGSALDHGLEAARAVVVEGIPSQPPRHLPPQPRAVGAGVGVGAPHPREPHARRHGVTEGPRGEREGHEEGGDNGGAGHAQGCRAISKEVTGSVVSEHSTPPLATRW